MKQNKKIAASVAAAFLALSLTGCVQFVGPGEESPGAPAPQNEAPAPAAEPGEDQPQGESTEGGEQSWKDKVNAAKDKVTGGSSDEGAEPSGTGGSDEVKQSKRIDLTPAAGVQYVRAIQGFSPEFEQWVFDREAGEMTYKRINCLGGSEASGSGRLVWTEAKGEDSAKVTITWDGNPPSQIGIPTTGDAEFELDDRNMQISTGDIASTKVDIEADRFQQKCTSAGKAVVDLVL